MPRIWTEAAAATILVAVAILALAPRALAQGPGGPPPADVNLVGLLMEFCDANGLVAPPALDHELREEVTRSGSVTVHMCEECHSVFISQDLLAVHILEEHMQQTHAQPKVSRQ